LKPKEAKAVAKKLLEAGKLTIQKKAPIKKSGFKRVGELPGQVRLISSCGAYMYMCVSMVTGNMIM
jgi:hypothetical protein